jgi:hypothetical protein
MRREDGYQRREDEPTRPVRVPRLSTIILNDTSRVIKVDPDPTPEPVPNSKGTTSRS